MWGYRPAHRSRDFHGSVTPPNSIYTNAVAAQAQSDLTTAYGVATSDPCGTVLTGQNLGGLTLTPGVYCFGSSAQLTGTLTLNALGNPNAEFVFQIASTLTTASSSSVLLIGGAAGDSVYWQVGSSATLGTATQFNGEILALSSITLNTGATISCGAALAQNGAVTLDTNTITPNSGTCEATNQAPEPSTAALFGTGGFLVLSWWGWKWRHRRACMKVAKGIYRSAVASSGSL
jgi:hypothetical protein